MFLKEHLWFMINTSTISYSRKFLNGANFGMFRTRAKCAKIRTYKNLERHTCIWSDMAFYRCLKPLQHSRCPCECGSHISLLWWWKKHVPWMEMFGLVQNVSQGCGLKDLDIWKLRTLNFYSTESTMLYKNIHGPTKLSCCTVFCHTYIFCPISWTSLFWL